MNFVNIKRFGPDVYRGNKFDPTRPNPQLNIGDKPFVPTLPPYRFIDHSIGVRGTPLIVANPNPNGYVNPVLEWDTNNPMDGLAWSPEAFGATGDTLYTAVFGIIDNGPESLRPMWPAIVKVEFLNPTGIKWSIFAENIEPGPQRLPEEGEPRRIRAHQRRRVQHATARRCTLPTTASST